MYNQKVACLTLKMGSPTNNEYCFPSLGGEELKTGGAGWIDIRYSRPSGLNRYFPILSQDRNKKTRLFLQPGFLCCLQKSPVFWSESMAANFFVG
jgi:hypothetical protein